MTLPLHPNQIAYAQTIIRIGKARGLSGTDITTAITVALTESGLQNYANSNVPESLNIPHDAVGSDHNSVGVFQQQVGIWGTAQELMNVETATNKFYDALEKVPTRSSMTIPQAAQTVQQSAFSDGSNYLLQVPLAEQVAGQLTGDSTYTTGKKAVTDADPIKWIMDSGNQKRIGLFILGAGIIAFAIVKLVSGTDVGKLAVKAAGKVIP